MPYKQKFTRRGFVTGAVAGLCITPSLSSLLAAEAKQNRCFKFGVCDWSIGAKQDVRAFDLAKEVGLDGIQVSFDGGPKFDLRQESVRKQYKDASKRTGVAISSMAMGVLNRVPFASDPRAAKWVEESIDVMVEMNVDTTLLAFFVKGDIKGDRNLQNAVIKKLKKIAPLAEKAGVTFGLETYLNVDDHIRILDAVGSDSVKVYYDVSNMLRQGYDIYKDIPRLGKDRIVRIHMKEKKKKLLGSGIVDFPRVRDAINDIGYQGWLVIESATDHVRPAVECHKKNLTYLRTLFPSA